MRFGFKILNTSLWLGVCYLALAAPACSDIPTPIYPTHSPGPTASVAVDIPMASPTNATRAPTSAVCPPPGDLAFPQPAEFVDYPDAIQSYLSTGGDLGTLRSKLIPWNALSQGADMAESCSAIISSAERCASVLAFFNDNYSYANPLWEPTDLRPFWGALCCRD